MRLGTFISIFALFVIVLLLIVPTVPAQLDAVPGAVPPSPVGTRCLTLSYPDSGPRHLPHTVALLPEFISPHIGYRLQGDSWEWYQGDWFFAGRDSVDLTTHHGAVLRVPIAGGQGRGVPYRDGPMLLAFIAMEPPFAVRATPISCPLLATIEPHSQPDSTGFVHRAFFSKATGLYPCRRPPLRIVRNLGHLSPAESCALTEWAWAYVTESLDSGLAKRVTPSDTVGMRGIASVEQWTVFDMSGGPTTYAWRVEFSRPKEPYDLAVRFDRNGPTAVEHITERSWQAR